MGNQSVSIFRAVQGETGCFGSFQYSVGLKRDRIGTTWTCGSMFHRGTSFCSSLVLAQASDSV
jgi:hypothetical protein